MANDFQLVELEDAGLTAHIAKKITYGESRAIDATLYGAANSTANKAGEVDTSFSGTLVLDWTMKKILTLCKRLVAKDGTEKPVNQEAIEALSQEDGKLLEAAVEKILGNIKKK